MSSSPLRDSLLSSVTSTSRWTFSYPLVTATDSVNANSSSSYQKVLGACGVQDPPSSPTWTRVLAVVVLSVCTPS